MCTPRSRWTARTGSVSKSSVATSPGRRSRRTAFPSSPKEWCATTSRPPGRTGRARCGFIRSTFWLDLLRWCRRRAFTWSDIRDALRPGRRCAPRSCVEGRGPRSRFNWSCFPSARTKPTRARRSTSQAGPPGHRGTLGRTFLRGFSQWTLRPVVDAAEG